MLPNVNLNPKETTQTTQTTQSTPQNTNVNISFSIKVPINILPGFKVPEGGSAKWEWSADQHALRFFINEQQNDQGQTEYVVKLMGTIYYNVALLGLEPADSAFFVRQGATTPIAFTNHGSYHIDAVIGTYASIADIQQLDLCNFLVTNVTQKIVGVDNSGAVYDVDINSPDSVNNYLIDPQSDNVSVPKGHYVALQGNQLITISYQNPPIS